MAFEKCPCVHDGSIGRIMAGKLFSVPASGFVGSPKTQVTCEGLRWPLNVKDYARAVGACCSLLDSLR